MKIMKSVMMELKETLFLKKNYTENFGLYNQLLFSLLNGIYRL